MSMVQEAIQLNNQAVDFLERKRFHEAILWSCAALETLQQQRHQQPPTTGADQLSQQQGRRDDSIDQIILNHNLKSHSDDNILNDDEFIYDQGIALPTTSDTPTMDLTSVITPVLIFNCALSHQLAVRHCNDENGTSHNYLERAKQLYQLAFKVQEQADMNGTVVFKFAIMNNIGVIHKRLGNYDESKKCFENLVSTMMVYVDIGVDSKRLQHIQGFWKNVLFMQENGGSIMPPAA